MKIEILGNNAVFLLPSVKVYGSKYSRSGAALGQSVARKIHQFLITNFGGYTCASGNIYGYFTSETLAYDELRQFSVSFNDESKLALLQNFLSNICFDLDEECIYLSYGNQAMLIYPEGPSG